LKHKNDELAMKIIRLEDEKEVTREKNEVLTS